MFDVDVWRGGAMTSDREPVLAGAHKDVLPHDDETPMPTEAALQRVRLAMSAVSGLLPVAEAAAEEFSSIFSAWETTITLIDDADYWDIVHVSHDDDDYPRFPDLRYALSDYPIGTERMMAGKGYVSGGAVDEVKVEYERQWPEVPVGSIMSIPIIAKGEIHGEIFVVRHRDTPPFSRDHLDLGSELATLFGARLPALVTTYLESRGGKGGSDALRGLTSELDEPGD